MQYQDAREKVNAVLEQAKMGYADMMHEKPEGHWWWCWLSGFLESNLLTAYWQLGDAEEKIKELETKLAEVNHE